MTAVALKGRVTEIFSSLQGEGLRLGERMIFVRLAGCSWRCRYCDTPASLSARTGTETTVEDVIDRVRSLREEQPQETVSLTGGEPLLQTEFLGALLTAMKRLNFFTYLETSGTYPELLKPVIDQTDLVAMDIKLPSAVGRPFWEEHADFLNISSGKVFVKIVLTEGTTDEELERSFRIAAAADPIPAVVLQPATAIVDLEARILRGKDGLSPDGPWVLPPSPSRLQQMWERFRRRLPDVRIIPQMHPIWGVR
jgi:organic radical activating enzyme